MSSSAPSLPSSNNNESGGIDIYQALDILSQRQPHHSHQPRTTTASTTSTTNSTTTSEHDDACHNHIPNGGKDMGQNIHWMEGETTEDIVASMEQQRRLIDQERQSRLVTIQTKLESMSVSELVAAVLEAQTGRVETYREYDEGLETLLKTSNVTNYPVLCAKATASFSVLSETINAIHTILKDTHHRDELSRIIAILQNHEKEKLSLTAALHLERIRQQNQMMNTIDGGDPRVTTLLNQGVTSIRQRISKCVEDINEALEELRYAIMDEN